MMTYGIIAGAVVLLFIIIYNILIGKKNQVENAFASIDTMLKKRYDLIPNLVESVKAYATHEKDILTKLTELRVKAISPQTSQDEKIQLEGEINKAMKGIMVAVENYPDLKASNNYLQLQGSWNEVEEQISASRRFFNSAVTEYNNSVEMFPTNLIAGIMGYKRKLVFEIPEVERQNISAKQMFAN